MWGVDVGLGGFWSCPPPNRVLDSNYQDGGKPPEEPTKENEMLNITTDADTIGNATMVTHTFTNTTAADQCVLGSIYRDATLTSLMVQRPGERPTVHKEDLEAKFVEHYAEFVARYA